MIVKLKPGESPQQKDEKHMQILKGHLSPETAYTVEDYPYGFRLRCRIRYWLEYVPKRGVRLWSQTTNPKKEGQPWNKPKASTFCRFGGAMFLNDEGHVAWSGCTEYMDLQELLNWQRVFGEGVPEACRPVLAEWIRRKTEFNEAKARGEVALITRTISPEGVITEGRTVLESEVIR